MSNYFWNKKKIVSYVLAILVFWIHCSTFANYDTSSPIVTNGSLFFQRTINCLAVPLFFIISGSLFFRDYSNKKYKTKIKNRINSLVIPFLIWNIINMCFEFIASTFFSNYFIGRTKAEFTLENVLLGVFHYKYNGPFWFVFALICFSIMAPIFDKLLKTKLTSVLSILVLIVLLYFGIGLPTPFFYNKDCIVYYLIGGFIGRFYFDWFTTKKNLKTSLFSLVMVILALFYYFIQNFYKLVNNTIISTFLIVIFSFCLWFSFDVFLTDSYEAKSFTNHSFIIFAIHINASAVITKLLYFLLPKNSCFSYVNFILTTSLVLLSAELISYLAKKISPNLYKYISGGR